MSTGSELVPNAPIEIGHVGVAVVPALISDAGSDAAKRFVEFFTANIRNRGTREVYARAVGGFCRWCERRRVRLHQVEPIIVAAYIEQLGRRLAKPTVKVHLAAVRMLFDYLVTGHVVNVNPASAVRGPKYVVKEGKTPVLSSDEARLLLDTIIGKPPDRKKDPGDEYVARATIGQLRDRALIGLMVYSFARVSAVAGMNVEDYFPQRNRWWIRLHEKGGKHHKVPAHHNAQQYMDEYIARAGIAGRKGTPLFPTLDRRRHLTNRRIHRNEVLAMIKRRARQAGLSPTVCCHTFRATGITAYLDNGGTIEKAQQIAAHESPRTTKLYDRTSDQVNLDEIERIVI